MAGPADSNEDFFPSRRQILDLRMGIIIITVIGNKQTNNRTNNRTNKQTTEQTNKRAKPTIGIIITVKDKNQPTESLSQSLRNKHTGVGIIIMATLTET